MIRDDLSDKLIHLTRGPTHHDAASAFSQILAEQKLRGSSQDIRGGSLCVCFSEAPVGKLGTILANPMSHGMRYSPFGVMVDKKWLFERGGRPVIYQTNEEFDLLHPDQQFRHVRYEPGKVDFTWEREWRIRADELPLDPDAVTFVVPNRRWEAKFHMHFLARVNIAAIVNRGFGGPSKVPWHFIVLEDLGVSIPDDPGEPAAEP